MPRPAVFEFGATSWRPPVNCSLSRSDTRCRVEPLVMATIEFGMLPLIQLAYPHTNLVDRCRSATADDFMGNAGRPATPRRFTRPSPRGIFLGVSFCMSFTFVKCVRADRAVPIPKQFLNERRAGHSPAVMACRVVEELPGARLRISCPIFRCRASTSLLLTVKLSGWPSASQSTR